MVREPLLSVLTLGLPYDKFLGLVKTLAENSESVEDFVNVMVKDFYVEEDYIAIVALVNTYYEINPLRGWFTQLYVDAKGKVVEQ